MSNDKLKAKLRKRQEELKKGGGNYDYFIFKEGTTRMRPLPTPPNKDWALEITHFYIGGEVKGVISAATFGERCALYEYWQKLKKSKKASDQKFADRMRPKQKFMVAHIKYEDDKGKTIDEKAGAKPALLHKGMYQSLLDFYLDDDKGDFTDPKTGYDIKYKRTGSGQMDTEYTLLDARPTKLASPYSKKTYDIEAMIRELVPSYETSVSYLEDFLKTSKKEAEEKDEDEAPRKKKKKKKRSDV